MRPREFLGPIAALSTTLLIRLSGLIQEAIRVPFGGILLEPVD